MFRTVSQARWPDFLKLQSSDLTARLTEIGQLWPSILVDDSDIPDEVLTYAQVRNAHVIEHPRLPFVSYPYEWPFALAKRAALLHIDLHLELLADGYSLVDGSAYNIQFTGTHPVFIDTLSITPYVEGEPWLGYQQFCTQFLNPLLVSAKLGVGYQAWFRGALEGISVEDTARILPWHGKLSWGVFAHVALHARLLSRVDRKDGTGKTRRRVRGPSKLGLIGLLRGLRRTINGLEPKGAKKTRWQDYDKDNSYSDAEFAAKRQFVGRFSERLRPAQLWDFGCNTGAFSEIAIDSGASRAVGFDFDLGALDLAVSRADAANLDLLPLHLDATNPSPSQGWSQMERAGLRERANAEGLLALAFLHHLVIGKNIPISDAVRWIVEFAPSGIIEFVPKEDPMVRGMLAQREDIFGDYDIDTFRRILSSVSRIVKEESVSPNGRTLFLYERQAVARADD